MVSNKDYNERRQDAQINWGGKVTKPEIMVFDNFYENPMRMRQWALKQEFTKPGNYPGLRTKGFQFDNWKEHIEYLMGFKIHSERWEASTYTGAFQSVPKEATTWVHSDNYNEYSAIVFLNPYAPPNTGTSFYEHRETGSREWSEEHAWINKTPAEHGPNVRESCRDDVWRRTDTIQNVWNRCVIFKGGLWHSADDYFGWDLESNRLTQTFFFDRADNKSLQNVDKEGWE